MELGSLGCMCHSQRIGFGRGISGSTAIRGEWSNWDCCHVGANISANIGRIGVIFPPRESASGVL